MREALTNALCHRLMDSPSGSVGIAIYDDRVEIENTGHLPNELTIETIKQSHRSYPQNPIIADALYKTAYLESWGTGVGRMIDACRDVGLPEPEYGTDGLFVWITFKRPVDSPIDSPSSVRVGAETIDRLIALIKANPSMTEKELAGALGRSVKTVKHGIRLLREKGILRRKDSPTVGGSWEIIDK